MQQTKILKAILKTFKANLIRIKYFKRHWESYKSFCLKSLKQLIVIYRWDKVSCVNRDGWIEEKEVVLEIAADKWKVFYKIKTNLKKEVEYDLRLVAHKMDWILQRIEVVIQDRIAIVKKLHILSNLTKIWKNIVFKEAFKNQMRTMTAFWAKNSWIKKIKW